MTRELIIDKLRKIAALAERGVGGEKENAKSQLEKMLTKHSLSIEDLTVSDIIMTDWFSYSRAWEKKLLMNCYRRVMNKAKVNYRINSPCRKIRFELTKLQEVELRDMYEFHRRLYAKELERVELAFTVKHSLHTVREDDGDKDESTLTAEEIRAIRAMMLGMSDSNYVGRNRQLVSAR